MRIASGCHAVLAVNDERADALAAEDGGLRSLTAALRRGARVAGNPAQKFLEGPPMNTVNEMSPITAARVPDEERMNTLPSHFGRHLLAVENAVYTWLRELSNEYSGGYWHFYELSNGGFYMAPECESLQLRVDGNGYEGRMSADAAGIVACLFALSHLSFQIPNDMLSAHFHQLLEFAAEHGEASAIMAATD